jgi:hypothetical protein
MDIDTPMDVPVASSSSPTPNGAAAKTASPPQSEAKASTPGPASDSQKTLVDELSASQETASTAQTVETMDATDVPNRAPSASASASVSVSASVSASASAADDAEHNDSQSSSSGASIGPASQASNSVASDVRVAGSDDNLEGMDRFLRRVEMEKVSPPNARHILIPLLTPAQKIAQLQQRLELASIKTNHGWTDMTINEIETVSVSPSLAC